MRGRVLINPEGTEAIYESMQFSQAVKVKDMIWVSGQVGIDEHFSIGEGIEKQSRMAFQNLKQILETAGGSLADIVELVTYHVSMKEMRQFAKALEIDILDRLLCKLIHYGSFDRALSKSSIRSAMFSIPAE